MTTVRRAVQDLSMRRHLGFKLHEAGKGLLNFVTFMEQHRALVITQAFARQPRGQALKFAAFGSKELLRQDFIDELEGAR